VDVKDQSTKKCVLCWSMLSCIQYGCSGFAELVRIDDVFDWISCMNDVRGTEWSDLIGQHTPVVSVLDWERNDVVSEKLASEEGEWFALEWLGMVVGNHLVGRTMFDFKFPFSIWSVK